MPDSTPSVRSDDPSARRVLVVDDNQDSAEMLATALATFGFEARHAFDGLTAIATAELFRPMAMLLDLGLPGGIDGYEVARRIREHPDLHDTKLIAVTGFGQARDRARSTAAGFDVHLVKPVDLTDLVRLLTIGDPSHATS